MHLPRHLLLLLPFHRAITMGAIVTAMESVMQPLEFVTVIMALLVISVTLQFHHHLPLVLTTELIVPVKVFVILQQTLVFVTLETQVMIAVLQYLLRKKLANLWVPKLIIAHNVFSLLQFTV
jgi:hypothetical protein